MDNQILSVSEFNALVNQTLEFAYPRVTIEGEISESRPTKHFYFSLKDSNATLRCIKWGPLRDPVEDGMKVRVTGRPQLHAKFGFSFIADTIEPAGQGSIQRAFELLRAKLDTEGLFSLERKRKLPEYPKTIGIISSLEAAGYKDFLKIVNDRWGGLDISVANVLVQGAESPGQVVRAIEYFNQQAVPPEVLAIVRGGGALEDLQAFNTEEVVRAIAASRAPTIVGVGHEVDTTLADLVADVRAATPTDAATKIVPSRQQVTMDINQIRANLSNAIESQVTDGRQNVQTAVNALEHFMYIPRARLLELRQQMSTWLLRSENNMINNKERVQQYMHSLIKSVTLQIQSSKWEVVSSMRALQNLDPKAVLARGYAIARAGGKVVKSANDIKIGEELMLQLAKDSITTEVTDVKTAE